MVPYGPLWRIEKNKKAEDLRSVLSMIEVMKFDLKNNAQGRRTIIDAIAWGAAMVLELLEPALRALHDDVLLRARARPRDGLARLQAVGAVGAATAVCLREVVRANGAQQQHVACAFAWRARRAVSSLVHDRVRVSLGGFA